MKQSNLSRATLGRLPLYLQYITSLSPQEGDTVSATAIAKALGLGEVQVRKDLSAVSGAGKPKVGYVTRELLDKLKDVLGHCCFSSAVVVGAGKLGVALLEYVGFAEYGLQIVAGFDKNGQKTGSLCSGKNIYPMADLGCFCKENRVDIGIITVPAPAAQQVCDEMIQNGITAIWNFAPVALKVPQGILIQQENLALSLAHLNLQRGQAEVEL